MMKLKSSTKKRGLYSRIVTGRAYGSSGVRRSDYLCAADYDRALWEAGGPGLNEFYCVSTSSSAGAYIAATFGANQDELNAALLQESKREQEMRPHIFLRKR